VRTTLAARREWRESDHELKVLRDQQETAKGNKEAKNVDRNGGAKSHLPEQAEINERLGKN